MNGHVEGKKDRQTVRQNDGRTDGQKDRGIDDKVKLRNSFLLKEHETKLKKQLVSQDYEYKNNKKCPVINIEFLYEKKMVNKNYYLRSELEKIRIPKQMTVIQ